MTGALPVHVDGVARAPGEPALAAEDLGFTSGLAALDTLRTTGGRRLFEELHLARLERTCRALGIPWPPPCDPARALAAYGEAVGRRELLLRTVVTRGVPGGAPRVIVSAREVERAPPAGAAYAVAAGDAPGPAWLAGLKTTGRAVHALARARARSLGAFDALLTTAAGELVCATSANVWAFVDGRVVTPAVERGALAGVSRSVLLAACEEAGVAAEVGALGAGAWERAEELFTTSSGAGLVPVAVLVGVERAFPGAEGPVARRLATLLAEAEARWRPGPRALFPG